MRELSLILLGAALVKSERKRITDSVPLGTLDRDLDAILDAIRTNDGRTVIRWLEGMGAKVQNGKDPIQAIVDCLLEAWRTAKVKQVVARLNYMRTGGEIPLEDIKASLREVLMELEEL